MILIITVKMPKWGPGLIAYGVHVTHLFQRRELVCPVLGHMASTVRADHIQWLGGDRASAACRRPPTSTQRGANPAFERDVILMSLEIADLCSERTGLHHPCPGARIEFGL
jgi:hypothetical protein